MLYHSQLPKEVLSLPNPSQRSAQTGQTLWCHLRKADSADGIIRGEKPRLFGSN